MKFWGHNVEIQNHTTVVNKCFSHQKYIYSWSVELDWIFKPLPFQRTRNGPNAKKRRINLGAYKRMKKQVMQNELLKKTENKWNKTWVGQTRDWA